MIFELCTDSLEGVLEAQHKQCKRVELCSALSIGGLTPSYGMVKQCVTLSDIEIHAMIRPREGDFVYTFLEIEQMEYDIKQFALLGVKGVVFGVLNEENEISNLNLRLLELAKSLELEVTFHRAFDFVKDTDLAIKMLLEFGFDRLLTSGCEKTAEEGLTLLKELEVNYGHLIQIMAGSGVNGGNIHQFVNAGIKQVHFTARIRVLESAQLDMGIKTEVDKTKIENIIGSVV